MDHQLKLYKKATQIAKIGLWELDLHTQKLTLDRETKQIFEIEESHQPDLREVLSYHIQSPGLENIEDLLRKFTSNTEVISSQYRIKARSGVVKWVKSHTQAEFINGRCSKLLGTLQDITGQQQLIENLEINQDRFHKAFDFAPIGMALVSPKGKWIKVNKSLCDLLGYSEKELLRRSFQKLTHPEDLYSDLEYVQKMLHKEISTYTMEKRYIHKNKEIVWVQLNVSLVWNKEETPLYFVSQIKDITEKKKAEAEQKKTMQIINDQNSRLVNFAHIVSHNLRSHSINLQMMLDLLADTKNEQEKEEIIGLLQQNASNLSDTIHNLNEVVNIQLSGSEPKKQLNLYQEIRKTLLSIKAITEKQHASFEINVVPDIYICYNPAYLDSILLNVLTNAIKYRSPKRNPRIQINAFIEQEQILLEIKDNGLGIDLELHGGALFGMHKTFHQNKDARGIGLFITKNQVESQGGRIEVESEVGKGTSFKIYIPKHGC